MLNFMVPMFKIMYLLPNNIACIVRRCSNRNGKHHNIAPAVTLSTCLQVVYKSEPILASACVLKQSPLDHNSQCLKQLERDLVWLELTVIRKKTISNSVGLKFRDTGVVQRFRCHATVPQNPDNLIMRGDHRTYLVCLHAATESKYISFS